MHEHKTAIIVQLMHGGRVSDPRCLLQGESPVSASALQSDGFVLYTDSDDEKHIRGIEGEWPQVNFPVARELSVAEIESVAKGFAEGVVRAIDAGADEAEVHGANGYLLYQKIIDPKTNKRTDSYGSSAENMFDLPNWFVRKYAMRLDWTDDRDATSDKPMPEVLRQPSGKPVIVNGGIAEGADVERVLSSGAGDVCAIGRPLFAHPDRGLVAYHSICCTL